MSSQCWWQSGSGQDLAHTEQPELLLHPLPQQAVLSQGLLHSWAQQCLPELPHGVFAEHPPARTRWDLLGCSQAAISGKWVVAPGLGKP